MKKHHHKERKNAICFIKHKMFVWRNKLAKQSLGPINQPPWPTLSSNWVPFLILLAKMKKKKNGYTIWRCRMCCTKKSYPSDWDLANWWHSGNIWTKRHQFFVFEFAQQEIWHLIDVNSLYWVLSLSKTVFLSEMKKKLSWKIVKVCIMFFIKFSQNVPKPVKIIIL